MIYARSIFEQQGVDVARREEITASDLFFLRSGRWKREVGDPFGCPVWAPCYMIGVISMEQMWESEPCEQWAGKKSAGKVGII